MIVTFYSYKGGVGRSMALANVARWLQTQRLRVVVVDWDLEAPGLETFFGDNASEKEALKEKIGLVELLTAYKELFSGLPAIPADIVDQSKEVSQDARDRLERMVELLNEVLPPLSHVLVPIKASSGDDQTSGTLFLLPAGSRLAGRFRRYAESVQGFDWSEFYAKFEGEAYFEWMRRQLTAAADIVLIDSRTGVAEMSGVCTRQLADVVVCFCAPNDQNLDGVERMAQSFSHRQDLLEARGRSRPIQLIMTPARVDISDGRPIDIFEDRFEQKLKQFAPPLFAQLGIFFHKLRIPYIKEYAYSERLAIGDPNGVKSLQEAYIMLAAHIAALAPGDSAVRRQCRQTLQRTFGVPTAFIVFFSAEEEPFATELSNRLQNAGTITVLTRDPPDFAIPLPASISPATSVVLAVGKRTLQDERAASMWWAARERGISLCFVTASATNQIDRPRWARKIPTYDPLSDWERLVTALQTPSQVTRVPLMAPPLSSPLIDRDNELQETRALLLGSDSRAIALLGLPGIGKTAIAQAICRDDDVIDTFDGGILWVNLGSQQHPQAGMEAALLALTGEKPQVDTLDETTRKLAEAISSRRCLLVLDDVAETEQLGRLRPVERGSKILITSRFRGVAGDLDAHTLDIGRLPKVAARQLLLAGIPTESIPETKVGELAQLLDNLPIALQLANRTVRARMSTEAPADVIVGLAEGIRGEGLEILELESSAIVGSSLFSSYSLALERVDVRERDRLSRLASLPSNETLSFEQVATALDLRLPKAKRLIRRLASMSLVEIVPDDGGVQVPIITSAYFKSLEQGDAGSGGNGEDVAQASRRRLDRGRGGGGVGPGPITDVNQLNIVSSAVALQIKTACGMNQGVQAAPAPTLAVPAKVTMPGNERWAVKTGQDPDRDKVGKNVINGQDLGAGIVPTTMEELISMPRPPGLEIITANPPQFQSRRAGTAEITIWQVDGNITVLNQETDGDYHLVFQGASGATLVARVPTPTATFIGDCPWLQNIKAARQAVDNKLIHNLNPRDFILPPGGTKLVPKNSLSGDFPVPDKLPESFRTPLDGEEVEMPTFQTAVKQTPARITGVGFFERAHGVTGAAPNGFEIHPVLKIEWM
jgi:hypothetical protein